MSRWFRVYDDMVDDPKVQRLGPDLFKALVNLWCLASKNEGKLPALDVVAYKLRLKEDRVLRILNELANCGLIDAVDGGWEPHNWSRRQYKSDVSNERVQRHRKRQRNVTVAVTVTPPETETEKNAASSDAPPKDDQAELFERGKSVLGKNSGGLIASLLKSKNGVVSLARSAVEAAASKQDPREYIGRIIRGPPQAQKVLSPFGTEYPDGIL